MPAQQKLSLSVNQPSENATIKLNQAFPVSGLAFDQFHHQRPLFASLNWSDSATLVEGDTLAGVICTDTCALTATA